jgi:lauroyl/myristoyl acyltransferase
MADAQSLSSDLTTLLGALPRGQLVEITRRAALGSFDATRRGLLGEKPLGALLKSLLPELSDQQVPAFAQRIALVAIRNSCWSGLQSLPGQWSVEIRCRTPEAAEALRNRKGPAIVAFWHHGATHMIALALHAIGVPALVVGGRTPPEWVTRTISPEMKFIPSRGARNAALALKLSLDRLRKGGVVTMAADGDDGHVSAKAPFLGRSVPVTSGMAALARITGAPIIPVLTSWGEQDWTVDFRIFDAVATPQVGSRDRGDWELEAMTGVAQRFEQIVRATPGQLRIECMARYMGGTGSR